jgi:hypothetical protein
MQYAAMLSAVLSFFDSIVGVPTMVQIRADEFWIRYRDEVRRSGNLDALRSTKLWTCVAIQAAKKVCEDAGLKTGNELYLDVMAYEQREVGVYYNWDLRRSARSRRLL